MKARHIHVDIQSRIKKNENEIKARLIDFWRQYSSITAVKPQALTIHQIYAAFHRQR